MANTLSGRDKIRMRFTRGVSGPAGTVSIGSTTTGAAGSNASVTNTGTPEAAVLNFVIPRGNTGPANTLAIGTVSTLPYGDPATASVTGTAPTQTLNLGLPMGAQGPSGSVADGNKADITVSGSGSTWTIVKPMREKLTAPRTYYVRPDGSDSNTGLANTSGGAFLTPQGAWDWIASNIDLAGHLVTIQVGNGTYTAGLSIAGRPGMGGRIYLRGDPTTPGNVVIAATTDDCLQTADYEVLVGGFRFTNSGGSALHAFRNGSILINDLCEFGACSEAHIFIDNSGKCTVTTGFGYRIVGSAPCHWLIHSNGTLLAATRPITLTGTPNFSSGFAVAVIGGAIEAADMTFTGAATGPRFVIESGGIIQTNTNGNLSYFPGNAAGINRGGYYDNLSETAPVSGSYTPDYRGATTAGSTSYSSRAGAYEKQGRMVFVTASVIWTAASGTGQAAVTLPFTASDGGAITAYYDNVAFGSGKQGVLFVSAGTNQALLYACDPVGGAAAGVSVEAAGDIRFSGWFRTT